MKLSTLFLSYGLFIAFIIIALNIAMYYATLDGLSPNMQVIRIVTYIGIVLCISFFIMYTRLLKR